MKNIKRFKVIVAGYPAGPESRLIRRLSQAGFELLSYTGPPSTENPVFMEALKSADAIVPGNLFRVDEALLGGLPGLKAVAKPGAGTDNIDLAAAKRNEVAVFSTPGANAQAVADHTFALILNLARKVNAADREVREGKWVKLQGFEIWQKQLGIIGLGAIGQAVARRAKGFEMAVAAFEPFWPHAFAEKWEIRSLGIEELLRTSDIVTVHCPLTPETRNLIGARELNLMKPEALLINTSRGGIIDEEALAKSLEAGKLAGAGLDAFEQEPLSDSPLLKMENVILTPHMAWFTRESVTRMEDGIANQLVDFSRGRIPSHLADPEIFDRSLRKG